MLKCVYKVIFVFSEIYFFGRDCNLEESRVISEISVQKRLNHEKWRSLCTPRIEKYVCKVISVFSENYFLVEIAISSNLALSPNTEKSTSSRPRRRTKHSSEGWWRAIRTFIHRNGDGKANEHVSWVGWTWWIQWRLDWKWSKQWGNWWTCSRSSWNHSKVKSIQNLNIRLGIQIR